MSQSDVSRLLEAAQAAAEEAGQLPLSDPTLAELLRRQADEVPCALALVKLVEGACIEFDDAPDLLARVLDEHRKDATVLSQLGFAAQNSTNKDYLNAPAPTPPVFRDIVEALQERLSNPRPGDEEARIVWALADTAARCGRAFDAICEEAQRRVLELEPENPVAHYDFGLFLKNRGRFTEGAEHNQIARNITAELDEDEDEATTWNLGICATGARQGQRALELWQRMGHKLRLGKFDLPEGGYPWCKVRVAEFPLAERGPERDELGPGEEETIWVERLSPCHGIVRGVLYGDLGVDYGDCVLFDGAPITTHQVGDRRVAVFPHLATLERREYHLFEFGGFQSKPDEISDLSDALPADGVVYSHTERFTQLCAECWEAGRDQHGHSQEERHAIVSGYLALPPEADLRSAYDSLRDALRRQPHLEFACPDLAQRAGYAARAELESSKLEALLS